MENSIETKEMLLQILGYLGNDVKGLAYSKGELFSTIVIGIVSLQVEKARLLKINKILKKQMAILAQGDIFREEIRRINLEKK